VHDLWTGLLLTAAHQPTVGFLADRIGQGFIGKWEFIAGGKWPSIPVAKRPGIANS